MVLAFLIITFCILVLYYASSNNTPVAATASAIRQVWTGNCRRACQQSSHLTGPVQTSYPVAMSRDDCVCETCPCAMIENVLRTFRPATDMYSNILEAISNLYINFLQSISDITRMASGAMECQASCQRPAQVITTNDLNTENSEDQNKPEKNKLKKKLKKTLGLLKKSSITFEEPLKNESNNAGETSTAKGSMKDDSSESMMKEYSDRGSGTMKQAPGVVGETSGPPSQNSSCSRCVEKGKTCMSECPRAKKR